MATMTKPSVHHTPNEIKTPTRSDNASTEKIFENNVNLNKLNVNIDSNGTLEEKTEESSPQPYPHEGITPMEGKQKDEIPTSESSILHNDIESTSLQPSVNVELHSDNETVNSSITSVTLWQGVSFIDLNAEDEDEHDLGNESRTLSLEENDINTINAIFETFESILKEESDLYSKSSCNSICASFYLKDGKMFYLSKGEKISLKLQLSWDRAFTAYELSEDTVSKPSSGLYETHGILNMEAQEGIPWRYTNSPGGLPVFSISASELVGGFSVCSNNSKYDERLSKKIILESGLSDQPYIHDDSIRCSEKPDGCNVSDNHWLIEYEKMWVLRKRVDNRQTKTNCQHKWKSPSDYFSQRGEYYWALCPLCEKAKETGTIIRRKKREGKGVVIKKVRVGKKV